MATEKRRREAVSVTITKGEGAPETYWVAERIHCGSRGWEYRLRKNSRIVRVCHAPVPGYYPTAARTSGERIEYHWGPES